MDGVFNPRYDSARVIWGWAVIKVITVEREFGSRGA